MGVLVVEASGELRPAGVLDIRRGGLGWPDWDAFVENSIAMLYTDFTYGCCLLDVVTAGFLGYITPL